MHHEEIKRRFRSKLIGNLIALVVIAPAAYVLLRAADGAERALGLPTSATFPFALVVAIAVAVYATVTWRCPSCGASLGKAVYPRSCPRCGAELR